MKSFQIALIACLLIMIGCTQENITLNSESLPDKEQIGAKALQLFPGTVRTIQAEEEEGIPAWKVDIINEKGAEVEIYCSQSDDSLLRIDGESGPFDYNIEPGDPLLNFDQAKAIADAQSNGTLEKWRLRREDKFDFSWVYTFEYSTLKTSIGAKNGDVLEIDD